MPALPARQTAIDVMRGLTLALMIVVNMSISETQSYAPLLHATWHGLTLTDVVFPSFLFVVGASMAWTLDRYAARGTPALLAKVARRTALIFLAGFLLYWFPFFSVDAAGHWTLRPLAEARIPGVLQRIALCYGIAALVVHFGRERGAWAFGVLALLLHGWALASFGDLTLQGNAVLRLDRWLLGEAHLYKGEGIPFDPEGVLSTLPSVANVLAGYLAAAWLRRKGTGHEAVALLLAAAALAVVVGLAWHGLMPMNKKLWTPAYAVVTSGIAAAVLALLVLAIDLRGWRAGTHFFEVFGRNTLFLYLLAELAMAVLWLTTVDGQATMLWLYEQGFRGWAGDKPGSLLFALAFMLACWAVGWAMDRRGWYVRL
jgi:predicted acyltransferase